MSHKYSLVTLAIISLITTFLGIFQVLNGDFSGHPYLLIPLGIFIWGDALIIGPFLFLCSIYLWFKKDPTCTGLLLSLYASIRSFIEIIYGLNAQFTKTTRPWEYPFLNMDLVKSLGVTELHVLYQVGFTCIFVVSSLIFLNYLKKYLFIRKQ